MELGTGGRTGGRICVMCVWASVGGDGGGAGGGGGCRHGSSRQCAGGSGAERLHLCARAHLCSVWTAWGPAGVHVCPCGSIRVMLCVSQCECLCVFCVQARDFTHMSVDV